MVRNKTYFFNLFVPDYIVTAADMQDLVDSSLFYLDDIGVDSSGKIYIDNSFINNIYNYPNYDIFKQPAIINHYITEIIFQGNIRTTSFIIPDLTSLTAIDCAGNSISSLTMSDNYPQLASITFNSNQISSFSLPLTLPLLSSLNFGANPLTSFLFPGTYLNLSTIILDNCHLSSLLLPAAVDTLTTLNLFSNDFPATATESLLSFIANSGRPVNINLSGGTNASHATWSPAAISAESTIIANGGFVTSNP